MKTRILLIMALLILMSALTALQRNLVVVEIATGTWCVYCPGSAMGAHDLLTNGHAVAIVKNHNGDSYANTFSNARNSYYNVTGYPSAFFDGLNVTAGGNATQSMYNNYLPKVNARLAIPSRYTIGAVGSSTGNQYTVIVTVTKPEADTNTNVVLHSSLTESNIPQVWFNQTTVENVNRLMAPSQNGTPINLATGEQTTVTLTFNVAANWNIANCELVLWLQNTVSKETLQGAKYSLAALTGAYPVSHETIQFPNMYVNGTSTIPITITNFNSTAATGTISISNPVFAVSTTTINIPPTQSTVVNVTFSPTAAQNYTGNLNITSNLYNHPNINIPLSGTGFLNVAPVATNVIISGPPVLYQAQTGNYTFSDADGNTEGTTIYKWYRVVNNVPTLITGANTNTYSAVELDLGFPLAFEVTPVDQHGMPGTPVMSTYTIPIEVLPPPQNFNAVFQTPHVILTWQRPVHFEGRGMVGYRIFRNGLNISTITNPNTLAFTDTHVAIGIHEYWICTLFNDPMMLSDPSNIVTVNVGVSNDDNVVSPVAVNVYPNPFVDSAIIEFSTKANQSVQIGIYNLKGQLVKTFDLTTDSAGLGNIRWDGTDSKGNAVNSGVYHYRLKSAEISRQGKIIKMN
ncbi:MAG: FlgD immunoglobulin-like domain containing protein [Candidatus Cloacimonadaceae bacterium]|nr:FlgD immunoglobulin-like domain containing protein [Candidatus Cloacimonadaceae bacterium]MDP3114762.1 FlgD immunoglobulin-like domain containing protein [Candidatus Cloacimonadaceae bacterium]